jgi:hypothetical protein
MSYENQIQGRHVGKVGPENYIDDAQAVARKVTITAANATVIAYLVLPHLPAQVLPSLTL